jgi:hypothetical protein
MGLPLALRGRLWSLGSSGVLAWPSRWRYRYELHANSLAERLLNRCICVSASAVLSVGQNSAPDGRYPLGSSRPRPLISLFWKSQNWNVASELMGSMGPWPG